MTNVNRRIAHLGRVSRKTVEAATRVISTVYGKERIVLIKDCDGCEETKALTNFYVLPNRQHIPSDELTAEDHRNICAVCHDAEVKSRTRRRKSEIKKEKLEQQEYVSNFLTFLWGEDDG